MDSLIRCADCCLLCLSVYLLVHTYKTLIDTLTPRNP